ncbi:hypothetical protein NT239_13335 [Chitinibacter sp. SCUT-21]|uniref:hypothetical protein n=1 Tax=Chitinibacter sp. SCUT-21 TaxID=2970891 RepID=UPI0035A57427
MLEKISFVIIVLTAGMTLAMFDVKPPMTKSTFSSPTVMCWPDEAPHTCWRRAEHRLGN